ncbi:MAG: TetR/AcrR family transcriptional regulator, partial [Tissierellia bacterium]|nr:TetR/AcrR family transcriptional regulator [Tissierellia bacterium]
KEKSMENDIEFKRRKEITKALRILYERMSFGEITIKEIGQITPFGRTSIYNYYQNKEEIFLSLMTEEYNFWRNDVEKINKKNDLSKKEFVDLFSKSLQKRCILLKLLSMNLYDIEMHARDKELLIFKEAYHDMIETIRHSLVKFFGYGKKEQDEILFSFFPFLFGIYPYTHISTKQREALNKLGIDRREFSIYELTSRFMNKILN